MWLTAKRIKGTEHKIEIINLNLDGSVKSIDRSKNVPAFDTTYTDDKQKRRINYQVLDEDFRKYRK